MTVNIVQGSSHDLVPGMRPFRLVAMGRSFHWMDRAATLAMLDRIVTPDGGVALFHDTHPPVEENGWFKVLRDVQDKFGRAAAPHVMERRGGHRRYEPFLFASAFTQIDGLSVTIKKPLTVDEIVGRAFSMSACSPQTLGDARSAFEARPDGGLAGIVAGWDIHRGRRTGRGCWRGGPTHNRGEHAATDIDGPDQGAQRCWRARPSCFCTCCPR